MSLIRLEFHYPVFRILGAVIAESESFYVYLPVSPFGTSPKLSKKEWKKFWSVHPFATPKFPGKVNINNPVYFLNIYLKQGYSLTSSSAAYFGEYKEEDASKYPEEDIEYAEAHYLLPKELMGDKE